MLRPILQRVYPIIIYVYILLDVCVSLMCASDLMCFDEVLRRY